MKFQAELASVTSNEINSFIFGMTEGNRENQGISIGAKQGPADFEEVCICYNLKIWLERKKIHLEGVGV